MNSIIETLMYAQTSTSQSDISEAAKASADVQRAQQAKDGESQSKKFIMVAYDTV